MTINDALLFGFDQLKKSGVRSYQLDTDLLLAKALFHPGKPTKDAFLSYVENIRRERLYLLSARQDINKTVTQIFQKLIIQRSHRVPIAYLTNVKEFYGIPFYVDRRVLIPRPSTELLVEKTLNEIKKTPHRKKTAIIDMGTGSGCIIISLAKTLSDGISDNIPTLIAIDSDARALVVAQRNARIHKVSNLIHFLNTEEIPEVTAARFIIVANLPYLNPALTSKLIRSTPELRYEPHHALFAPNRGLKHYMNLIQQLKRNQKKRIPTTCFFEIDLCQRKILSQYINQALSCKNSYHDRIIEFRFP